MKKYHILYAVHNLVNGKFYIGVHATDDLEDGYLGSGSHIKKAVRKHRKHNFRREILAFCDSVDEMNYLEGLMVDEEMIARRDCYNADLGGRGGKIWTPELREAMSKAKAGGEPWNKGQKIGNFFSDEQRKSISERNSGSGNGMHGVNVFELVGEEKAAEMRQKISESNRKPKSKKDGYSIAAKNRIWITSRSGIVTHTMDPNDPRLSSPDWQRGRKWKP